MKTLYVEDQDGVHGQRALIVKVAFDGDIIIDQFIAGVQENAFS